MSYFDISYGSLTMQQPSNIILIRGARTENGQIILQNGHELLSLLNSGAVSISSSGGGGGSGGVDDDKITCGTSTSSQSILLQSSRIKATNVVNTQTNTTTGTGTSSSTNAENGPLFCRTSTGTTNFVIQSALKNSSITTNQLIDANALSGNGVKNQATTQTSNTVLLHSTQALKKTHATTSNASATGLNNVASSNASATTTTAIPEGSIILQQRLNKNGTSDGPILLQTLKRLDKSQSILLFRNTQTTGSTTCTLTTASPSILKTTNVGNQITVIANKDDDKTETKPKQKPVSLNVPLGAGEYNFPFSILFSLLQSKNENFNNNLNSIER